MPTILVIDDEAHIRDVVQYALEREGHAVLVAGSGEEGLQRLEQQAVDLVVLDILMPGADGLEVCRRIRTRSRVPIIFLSSKSEEVDRIVGLELGADDYLPKPFSPRELVARVKAVLRRLSAPVPSEASAPLRVGPVTLDTGRHEVRCNGEEVALSVTEFAVLQALLARPGQVLTRALLVRGAYSAGHHITERTIDTHIRRIRAKFRPAGHDPIETVHGLGYRAREP